LLAESREAASFIATVEGLIWKIWVSQEDAFELGGMYLFANRETAEAYLKHPIVQALRLNPDVVSTHSELWDIETSLSALTRAPLPEICVQHSQPEAILAGGR
jgi:hypothetical protein